MWLTLGREGRTAQGNIFTNHPQKKTLCVCVFNESDKSNSPWHMLHCQRRQLQSDWESSSVQCKWQRETWRRILERNTLVNIPVHLYSLREGQIKHQMITEVADSLAHGVPCDNLVKISQRRVSLICSIYTVKALYFIRNKSITRVLQIFERAVTMHTSCQPMGGFKQLLR